MKDLPVVNMLDGKGHLNKPVQDLIFTVANTADFLLIRDLGVKITTICKVHHDAKATLVHEGLFICDDVGVTHCFENMDLYDTKINISDRMKIMEPFFQNAYDILTSLMASSLCFLSIFDTSMI